MCGGGVLSVGIQQFVFFFCLFFCVCAQTYTKALPLFMHFVTVHSSNQIFMFTFPPNYTFELSGLQQFFPLRADFFHVTRNLSWGIMLSIQQLLAWLLQGIDSALVSRQLCFKGLVFLHLALQVGGVLLTGEQRHRISAMEKTDTKENITMHKWTSKKWETQISGEDNINFFHKLPCKPHQ